MLCHNIMTRILADPLALSAGVLPRLALAAGLTALLWAGVFWALAT